MCIRIAQCSCMRMFGKWNLWYVMRQGSILYMLVNPEEPFNCVGLRRSCMQYDKTSAWVQVGVGYTHSLWFLSSLILLSLRREDGFPYELYVNHATPTNKTAYAERNNSSWWFCTILFCVPEVGFLDSSVTCCFDFVSWFRLHEQSQRPGVIQWYYSSLIISNKLGRSLLEQCIGTTTHDQRS